MSNGQYLILIGTLLYIASTIHYTAARDKTWEWRLPAMVGGAIGGVGISMVIH